MRNYFTKSLLALACLTMILMPAPMNAQSAGMGMYISVNPTAVLAGEWAGVSAVVTNSSSSKERITVTFKAVDPCGNEMDLGYNRLALAPGQSVLVTTAYPTSASACRGMHTITISTGNGRKNSSGSNASAYLEVQ
jgi:hypothetical protein